MRCEFFEQQKRYAIQCVILKSLNRKTETNAKGIVVYAKGKTCNNTATHELHFCNCLTAIPIREGKDKHNVKSDSKLLVV
jgi:hypothetical protein